MTTEDQMKGPLKHRTLSAAIVDQLRQAIFDGTYPAGSQLRQDALGDAYGVSRIPVREALFQLEAEGLVRIVPQKGAIVSELSLDEINDVFDLRGIMEPRLLAQSAPHFAEQDFAGLDDIQKRFVKAINARNVSEWGSSMPTFTWRCTFTRASPAPRRSSWRCCKPATATRACSSPTPRRWGRPKKNTPT